MTPIGPPADVDPVDLFLTLLEYRPSRPLQLRLEAAPDVELGVVAITAPEAERAFRGGNAALLSAIVTADGEKAFDSVAHVGMLDSDEEASLRVEALSALDHICPLYRRVDSHAWGHVLKIGAQRCTQVSRGFISCLDITPTFGPKPLRHEHPERYWGCAVGDLLDGHWLVFRAAIEHFYR